MKKLIICMSAMMLTCGLAKAQGTFTINGNVTNAEGQKIYLAYNDGTEGYKDSTVIKDNKFTLKGTISVPYYGGYMIVGDRNDQMNPKSWTIALEPGTITISGDVNNASKLVIKGGKTQDELNAMNAKLYDVMTKSRKLNEEYYARETQKEKDSIRALIDPCVKVIGDAQKEFYTTHPNSYLSTGYLYQIMGDMSYTDLKSIYDKFSDNVKKYGDFSKDIRVELAALERVQPGKVAPDFTATDINGKSFTMSSLKGKVVIIDFWASWCVPCRASNPHMRELYAKYHDKGLEMVYVSDDDSNPAKWRAAVQKDQLVGEGFHHLLRGFKWDQSKGLAGMDKTNDISEKYAVSFLPTKYLIDKNGKIVCKIGEGEDAKIDQLITDLLK